MPVDVDGIDWHHVGSIHNQGQEYVERFWARDEERGAGGCRAIKTRGAGLALGALVSAFVGMAVYAEPGPEGLTQVLNAHRSRERMRQALPDLNAATATEIQDFLLMNLAPDEGSPVGYLREMASDGTPVSVVLLENLFTSSGATLRAAQNAKQLVQLELLVRINSAQIDEAGTRSSVAAGISEVVPAVVVRDQLLFSAQQGDAAALTAINAGVRYLVLGRPLSVPLWENTQYWHKPFGARLVGRDGQILSQGHSLAGGISPLEAVLEIKRMLHQRGRSLRAGDLLGLGAIGSAVVLSGAGRLEADFDTPFGWGQVIFALH